MTILSIHGRRRLREDLVICCFGMINGVKVAKLLVVSTLRRGADFSSFTSVTSGRDQSEEEAGSTPTTTTMHLHSSQPGSKAKGFLSLWCMPVVAFLFTSVPSAASGRGRHQRPAPPCRLGKAPQQRLSPPLLCSWLAGCVQRWRQPVQKGSSGGWACTACAPCSSQEQEAGWVCTLFIVMQATAAS